MIGSFDDVVASDIVNGKFTKALPHDVQSKAFQKLEMLQNTDNLQDLLTPGNRLEKLKGKRQGSYSIRVNDRFRIQFVFQDGRFENVRIVDYH